MPTTQRSTARSSDRSTGKSTRAKTNDATRLLTKDHDAVKALFEQYEELVEDEADDEEKQTLAEDICDMLTVHATIEEEIFYPAAREALQEGDLVDEATVEHASAKDLIAQIDAAEPGDELYDAKVTVLGEYIRHHVKEEEKSMFPKIRKSELDTRELGQKLQSKKEKLQTERTAH